MQELIEEIGRGIVRSVATPDWTRLELELTGAGRILESGLAAHRHDGVVDRELEIDDQTAFACAQLRKSMFQPGKGTWYNAAFSLDASSQLESSFDYDSPPLNGHAVDELLIADQERFPRDPEHLPDWHPSRRAD